jgi:hypothetical protein
MKATLILLGSGLLAATLAVAQDAPANGSQDNTANQTQTNQTTHSDQTSNAVLRGCLSGSAGNYTITDQNGTQYSVNGPENQLQASVGHEVELATRQDDMNQSSAQGGQTTSSTTNSVQVSKLRDVASTCSTGHSTSTPPMNDQANPKGTPDAAEPPQAQPQTIAMLQQDSKPDVGSTAPQQQTTPAVTSQTPATPGAATSSTQQNAQQGAATSTTTTSTTSTTTTNEQTGTAPSTGTTSTADQNATTSSPNAATPNANAQQPQANTSSNDQNKPLYERQATDIPWANSSNNSGTNNSNSGANNPSEQNPH